MACAASIRDVAFCAAASPCRDSATAVGSCAERNSANGGRDKPTSKRGAGTFCSATDYGSGNVTPRKTHDSAHATRAGTDASGSLCACISRHGGRFHPDKLQTTRRPKACPDSCRGVVLISLVTIGIFLAVRVGKNPEATAPEIVAGRPMRPNGPARLAADAMKKSFESLARGCDLELARGTEVDASLFSAAYAQCGMRVGAAFPPPGLRVDKPRTFDPNDSTNEPTNAGPNSPGVNTPRQTNPGRDSAPRPAPAPGPAKAPANDGCINKCSATQRQCNQGCGSEPTSSAAYDRWQGCQTQCLSAASRCRLACQ